MNDMEKKYELTDEKIIVDGTTLYRIRALRDIGDSVKSGDLGGYVEGDNNLSHSGTSWVFDNAQVFGDAHVYGNAWVYCNAQVYGNALVYGDAHVYGNAWVYGNALVYGDAHVYGNAWVYGNALVYGNAWVYGYAYVCDNAVIRNTRDYIVFKNWWSSGRYFTWTRSNDKWTVGCFHGTGQELIAKVYKDSELSGREYERIVNYVESIKNTISKL